MIFSQSVSKFQSFRNLHHFIKPCTIIACADHGVVSEAVSAYPKATTYQMLKNYVLDRGAAANVFSSFTGSALLAVDVGVDNEEVDSIDGVLHRKIASGTRNFTLGPAMTIEQASASINIGIDIVQTLARDGFNCFLPGEMGIGNTTSTAAITSLLLDLPPEVVTGRGSNISEERLAHKIEIIKKSLAANAGLGIYNPELEKSNKDKAFEALSKFGGFEIGTLTGIILGAWRSQSLVILDGFNNAAAALLAYFIEPACIESIIPSHISRENGHKFILDFLGLSPTLNLNLALGEAIGSSILLNILNNFSESPDEPSFNWDGFDDISYDDDHDDLDDDDINDPYDDYDEDDLDNDEEDDDLEFDSYDHLFDDDEFDIELNIFNDNSSDMRYNDDFTGPQFYVDFCKLDDSNISVTDRTFNFYMNTMPSLDSRAMSRAQAYIDSLTKPVSSLGVLEEIVVQIAGISSEPQPSFSLKSSLICFTDLSSPALDLKIACDDRETVDQNNPFFDIFKCSKNFDVPLVLAAVSADKDSSTAFDFGRMTAEDLSFKVPIIALTIKSVPNSDDIDFRTELDNLLLNLDGSLKFNADDFLRHIPKNRRNLVSAVIGAVVAAAHNSSLVIVDSGPTDLIAKYIELLCPAISPYILHADKLFYHTKFESPDELEAHCALFAIDIVRAALFAIANMKTFKETGVSSSEY